MSNIWMIVKLRDLKTGQKVSEKSKLMCQFGGPRSSMFPSVLEHCRTAMYSSDCGFPWDSFYKVKEVGWYVMKRVSLVTVVGWDCEKSSSQNKNNVFII